MICGSCAKAGDLLPALRLDYPREFREKVIKELVLDIETFHAQCRPGGTWCDCQHAVPGAIS